jgi:hypothetical protein
MSKQQTKTRELNVRFVSDSRFHPKPPHYFKQVLEDLLKQPPGKIAEIPCDNEESARKLQRRFHSSGAGRRMKRDGYRLETACRGSVVQIRLSKAA